MKAEPEAARPRRSRVAGTRRELLKRAFDLCIRKTRDNIQRLADDPRSAAWAVDGNYFAFKEGFHDIGNWTSSFFTGMALIAWEETQDYHFLEQTLRLAPWYFDKVHKHHRNTMQNLGFLYSLYSVALFKLAGDEVDREVGLRAADLLANRFMPRAGCIRAWGAMDSSEFDNLAIVDCMMNLPLLFWAAEQTGEDRYGTVAREHAATVLKHFIRPDGAVYPAWRFDPETGRATRPDTFGGCAVESQWARGAAWAMYGFALSYRYCRAPELLQAARRIAVNFVACLGADAVPQWDFSLQEGAQPLRDASAGSIAVCGLQEILSFKSDPVLAAAKERMLGGLCSEEYLNFDPECPGIQRLGQVGDGPTGGAKNAYTSWGDYFLTEALARELSGARGYW